MSKNKPDIVILRDIVLRVSLAKNYSIYFILVVEYFHNYSLDIMKDSYLYSFLVEMVQEKHGDEIEIEFLESEVDHLNVDLSEKLLLYFEPMLEEALKVEFEELVQREASIGEILGFFASNISNFEEGVVDFLEHYRRRYLLQKD